MEPVSSFVDKSTFLPPPRSQTITEPGSDCQRAIGTHSSTTHVKPVSDAKDAGSVPFRWLLDKSSCLTVSTKDSRQS
jgi:hypothetical protein